jgi:hypothetical protein
MLAEVENAREIVDCDTPSLRATSSAVTFGPDRLTLITSLSNQTFIGLDARMRWRGRCRRRPHPRASGIFGINLPVEEE